MKKLLLLTLFLTGCASIRPSQTVFLKETDRKFYNLKGEGCMISGYEIKPNLSSNNYRLVTSFSNCACHEERTLEEMEIKQWIK